MSKLLAYLQANKGKVGVLIAFCAGGARAIGYPEVEHALLYLGTLLGVGYLPKAKSE